MRRPALRLRALTATQLRDCRLSLVWASAHMPLPNTASVTEPRTLKILTAVHASFAPFWPDHQFWQIRRMKSGANSIILRMPAAPRIPVFVFLHPVEARGLDSPQRLGGRVSPRFASKNIHAANAATIAMRAGHIDI